MRKTKVKTQGQIALVCTCCQAPAVQRIVRRTRTLCLFGQDVLPLGRAHVIHCTLCGGAAPLDNREADALIRSLRGSGPTAADLDLTHEAIEIF